MTLGEVQSQLNELGCKGRELFAKYKKASTDGKSYATTSDESTELSAWLNNVKAIAYSSPECQYKLEYCEQCQNVFVNGVVNMDALEYVTKHLNTTDKNLLKNFSRFADSISDGANDGFSIIL